MGRWWPACYRAGALSVAVHAWDLLKVTSIFITSAIVSSEVKSSEVSQSCPTLCDPADCSLPGSSIHGILQAGVLEWVTISSPGELPNPGIEPGSAALEADALTSEPPV